MRPEYYSKRLSSLIKEEFDKVISDINEIFDTPLQTDYITIERTINGFNTKTNRFKTLSGESYDLEFIDTSVSPKIKLDNGSTLCDILNINCNYFIGSIDIGFTLTSRTLKYDDNVDVDDEIENDEYSTNTNKNESIEVMKRISYLVKEFINENSNINIYAIGRNTHETKLLIYKKLFENIFKEDFILTEGISTGYKEGALYFINKKILK